MTHHLMDLRTTNYLIVSESGSLLKIFNRFLLVDLTPKSGEEWRRRVASTLILAVITKSKGKSTFEIKYAI